MNLILLILFAVDVAGTVLGVCAMGSRSVCRKFTAISAGVMVGVALFWIFPDMTRNSGMVHAGLAVGVALAALYGIDRFVFPVCPCCAHEGHAAPAGTSDPLLPLVIAICLHNLFDGWTAAVAGSAGSRTGSGMAFGLLAHKVPEAIVFGLILRGATNRPRLAVACGCLTGVAILAGGSLRSLLSMLSENTVIAASLSLACGSFLFAGAHIFFRQQRHGGIRSALKPLLVGVLLSAAAEQAVSSALAQWR